MKRGIVISKIRKAFVRIYRDGICAVTIEWQTSDGCVGHTTGDISSQHMVALLARARREGVEIQEDRV